MAVPVALPNLRGYVVQSGRRNSAGNRTSRDCMVLVWDDGYDTTINQLSVGYTTTNDASTVPNYIAVDYWHQNDPATSVTVTDYRFPRSDSAFYDIPHGGDNDFYFALVGNNDGITLFPFNVVAIEDIATAVAPAPDPTPTPDPTPPTPPAVPESTYRQLHPATAGSYTGLFTDLEFGDRVTELSTVFGYTSSRRNSAVLTTLYDVNMAAGGTVTFLGVNWNIAHSEALLVDGQWVGFRYDLEVTT